MIFKQQTLHESITSRLAVFNVGGSGGLSMRVTTKGGEQVRQALKKLGQAPRKALDRTAEQVEEYVERQAKKHSKSGALFASIGKKRTSKGWIVGHDTQRAKHALFVHWGTRAHVIVPNKKKALRWVGGDKFAFAKKVRHPGNKADPWFVRAASQAPLMFQRHVERVLAERQSGS